MKKILVPTDGSDCSNLAIDMAKDIAVKFDSEIMLLYVNDITSVENLYSSEFGTSFTVPDVYRENLEMIANSILDAGKERIGKGVKVSSVAIQGKPADVIIKYVDNNDVDLVVMGSHGMSGFRRFFVGSVTHKVALSIEKPILIVR